MCHAGGVVGVTQAPTRRARPQWFQDAIRLHTGGIAGLASDEVPAILRRGEEVLTSTDARHRVNGGLSGSDSVTQVLAIGEDQIAKAMRSASGCRIVLTHIKEESETVRQMLQR
jgi:hypothetical protein